MTTATYQAPPVAPAAKVRPSEAIVVALLQSIGGILAIFAGLLAMGIGAAIPIVGIVAIIAGGISILIGLALLLVAWGLYAGKGWARMIAIILNVLSIIVNLFGALGGSLPAIASLLISLVIVVLLFRPNMKAYYA